MDSCVTACTKESTMTKVGATTTAQLVWILAARLPGPDGEVVLSSSIDSMGAESEDGIL